MVEACVWYLVEVNSIFRFVYHITVLLTSDGRLLFCVRKGRVFTIHGISLTFVYCSHSAMNGIIAFENAIAFIEFIKKDIYKDKDVRAAFQICLTCISCRMLRQTMLQLYVAECYVNPLFIHCF